MNIAEPRGDYFGEVEISLRSILDICRSRSINYRATLAFRDDRFAWARAQEPQKLLPLLPAGYIPARPLSSRAYTRC